MSGGNAQNRIWFHEIAMIWVESTQITNVTDSNKLERDAGGKPHTLFLVRSNSPAKALQFGNASNWHDPTNCGEYLYMLTNKLMFFMRLK